MPFKKGDIVEITEDDSCGEHTYYVGTQWLVVNTTHMCVVVKDDRQPSGECMIFKYKVKLIEEENKMLKFKEGQTYICTESHASQWTVGREYPVFIDNYENYFVIKDDEGSHWYDYELNTRKHKFILKDEPLAENPPMEKEQEKRITDLIDNQPHYKNQGIEPIDLMRKNFSKEEFAGFLQGNVLKYMLRYKDKNGVEDLKKANTYLTWLIEEEEE